MEISGVGIKPFSDGGDSGSLIVDEQGYARALLFSGGEDFTFANPIELVLGKLGIRLAL